MNQSVLVLPGTVWQIPLIKKLKDKGYRVIVVHPTSDGAALPFADDVVFADILDKGAVLTAAKRKGVVGVMSDECDIATPTLAYVSSKLGLPTQTEPIAKLFTDKSQMRDFCVKHNLPCPRYRVCKDLDEALDFYHSLGSKMIIKPIDANSSRGVFTITSEIELMDKFDKSLFYSHHRSVVICEQFIDGAEFSVDGIRLPQGHVSLAVSEKTQFDYNKNLDNYLFFSYDNPYYDYDRLRLINNRFVDASGLPFGFTHAEYRYENGEFYLLEIGARGGGNLISSHIVPALTGIDTYSLLIDMFVGNMVDSTIDISSLKTDKIAVLQFFDTTERGGTVKDIQGLEWMDSKEEILYYQLNFQKGDTIHRPTDGGNRIGFYIACCSNREKMSALQSEINEHFLIEYE